MENFFKAIILGIVQGFTEFLPISSSGHLKIISQFWNNNLENNIAFDISVHFATLLVVLWFYRNVYLEMGKSIIVTFQENRGNLVKSYRENADFKVMFFALVTTLITGIIGLKFKDSFENITVNQVGYLLLITSVILFLPKIFKKSEKSILNLTIIFAIILGFAQAFAILPGISRSGTTITIALLLGANRKFAGIYSFLIMIPAVLGATLLHLKDISGIEPLVLAGGFFAAFFAGIFALKCLIKLLNSGKFWYFSPYCLIVGLLVIIFIK